MRLYLKNSFWIHRIENIINIFFSIFLFLSSIVITGIFTNSFALVFINWFINDFDFQNMLYQLLRAFWYWLCSIHWIINIGISLIIALIFFILRTYMTTYQNTTRNNIKNRESYLVLYICNNIIITTLFILIILVIAPIVFNFFKLPLLEKLPKENLITMFYQLLFWKLYLNSFIISIIITFISFFLPNWYMKQEYEKYALLYKEHINSLLLSTIFLLLIPLLFIFF